MNVCESEAEALHCSRDNGIVSLRPSIDRIVITTKSRAAPSAQSSADNQGSSHRVVLHHSNPAPNLIGSGETNAPNPRATNTLPPALPLIFCDPTDTKSETSSPSKIYRLSSQNA
jgi:hypothetical protein